MPRSPLGDVLQFIHLACAKEGACDLTDRELLDRFVAQGDQSAFALLVRRHGPLVFNVCRRLLGNVHEAEDAFQATFLVLARRPGSIRSKDSVGTWLYTVSQRIALRARAQAATRRHRERQARNMGNARMNDPTCEELRTALDEAIGTLPEKYRAPIVLCYLESKTYEQASQELGCPKDSLAKRLIRAKELLRRKLERRGIGLAAAALTTALAEMGSAAPLPAMLTIKTVKAVALVAAGKSVAGCISAGAVALAEEAVAGMVAIKGKMILMVLALGLAVGGAGWAGYGSLVEKSESASAAEAPGVKGLAGIPAKKEPKVATDQYGDPLPEGAVARLGTKRFRHDGNATALAFTRDGKTLVGRTNSGIVLWDAATGKERKRLAGSLHSLYFHDAAGGTDDSGGMDISHDGATLALSDYGPSEEPKVSLWNLATGKNVRTLSLPKDKGSNTRGSPCFIRLSFAPDGKNLAWGNAANGTVVIFDLASGRVHLSLGGGNSLAFYNFAISPDSKTLVAAVCSSDPKSVGSNHGVQMWDMATGKILRTIHELPDKNSETFVGKLAFSADGSTLAFGIKDRIYRCDVAKGNKLGHLEAKMGQVNNLAFTPDGKTLVSGSAGDKTRVWDLMTAKLRHTFETGRYGAVAPDGGSVALFDDPAVRIWDVTTGRERFPEYHGHNSWISHLAFSPDGKTLVSTGYNGPIFFWDMASKQQTGILPWQGNAFSFSSDGKMLATVPSSDGPRNKVRVWDVFEKKQALEITVPDANYVASSVFSGDGRKLLTLTCNQVQDCIRQWDLATGKQDRLWKPTPKGSEQLLAPDGNKVFAVLDKDSGLVSIYDVQSGRSRFLLGRENESNWILMPSPDHRILACGAGSGDRGVRLWELPTDKEILFLKGNKGAGGGIAWSPDGTLLAGGDRRVLHGTSYGLSQERTMSWLTMQKMLDPTVRVWDAATGKEVAHFRGFKTDVSALSFSPDGAYLAAGLADSTILIWDVTKVNPRKGKAATLSQDLLETCWTDLRDNDAGKAHQAVGTLVAAFKDSVPFIRGRIKPVESPNAHKIQEWIADSDSDMFATRQTATKELEKAGEQVTDPIRKALKGNISLEARRRLEQILKNLSDVPGPETVRTIRAIMALERIGSPEAQSVLVVLAGGAPGARETEEAKASVERLRQRAARTP